jgi:IS1 family transposase
MINSCRKCGSFAIRKNGHAKNGKQQYHCSCCGAGFVETPSTNRIPEDRQALIENALKERNSLRAICRIFSVSITWLLGFATELYQRIPKDLGAKLPSFSGFAITVIESEADELWSFVGCKKKPAWIWIIMERGSGQVIAFHVGGRTKRDAKELWRKLPIEYRRNLIVYTDFLKSYAAALPAQQHIASGKDAGQTNRIERLNCTIRQRVARLVRNTLSFSKKLANHVGAIGFFLFHYNREVNKLRT